MSAYIVFNYRILNRVEIVKVRDMVEPLLKKYNAKVIAASPVEIVEGSAYPNMVIHKFNSMADAKNFYYSDEHQKIVALLKEITEGQTMIVPG